MKNFLIILLITFSLNSLSRGYFSTASINYPLPFNEFKGVFGTSFYFHQYLPFNFPDIKIGGSYSLLKNQSNQNLSNVFANLGLTKKIDFGEKASIYPYITSGYSFFKDQQVFNHGFSIELGTDLAKKTYFRTVTLNLAYRHNLLKAFFYENEKRKISGNFGMLSVGCSYLF